MKNIRIGEALAFGFKKFYRNIILFIGIFLIFFVYSSPIVLLMDFNIFTGVPDFIKLIILIFSAVGMIVCVVGYIKVNLELCDYGKSSIKVFYNNFFWKLRRGCALIAYSLLMVFIQLFIFAVLSTLLLIIAKGFTPPKEGFGLTLLWLLIPFGVPMVFIHLRFWFASYLIVDKNLGAVASLRRSWHMTKGKVGTLFLFLFVGSFIRIIPFLFPIVTLLFPIITLASMHVYRQSVGKSD